MKILKLLIPFLVLALLFTACAKTDAGEQNTTAASTESAQPQSPIGIWRSDKEGYAVQIHSSTSITYYKLKNGFYRYLETGDLTCEDVVGEDLLLTTYEGDELALHFDAEKGALSNPITGNTYTRTERTPLLYHEFPRFADMNVMSLVTLPGLGDLSYPESARGTAARNIFDEIYKNTEAPPMVTSRQLAEMGDYVNIDYKGLLDGVAFDGGTATNQRVLVVSNSGYIPGFAEGIAGHTVGETFDVEVTFPENYGSADLAGKNAVFQMTLNAIYDMTSITDAMIKEATASAYETYEAYLSDLSDDAAIEILWSDLMNSATFGELPEESYAFFYQYFSDSYRDYADQYGMEYETFLNMMVGISDMYLKNQSKSYAKTYIVSYLIASENGITVSDEMIQEEVDLIKQEMEAQHITPDEIEAYFDEEQMTLIETDLLHREVLNWLLAQAKAS